MKKSTSLILALSLLLMNCSDDPNQNACKADDPMEIEWVIELKNSLQNCTCEMSVIQGTYEGLTVFYTTMTDPVCNGINTPTLYGCNGGVIDIITTETSQKFQSEVGNINVLYRCKSN